MSFIQPDMISSHKPLGPISDPESRYLFVFLKNPKMGNRPATRGPLQRGTRPPARWSSDSRERKDRSLIGKMF
jgi:hypothetical protein